MAARKARGTVGSRLAVAKGRPGARGARGGSARSGGRATAGAAAARVVKVVAARRESAGYEVRIGAGLLPGCADGLIGPGGAVLVVVDSHLGPGVIEPVIRSLDRAKARWGVCVVSATEADKSLATAERALAEAGRLRLGRDGLVIGIGGGIVTDVAGFVAAVFARGVRVVQCPASLLAMVDAAVGGKTAVNLRVAEGTGGSTGGSGSRLVKNAVGVFHAPARVVCDVGTLETLPRREVRCGLAECVKHALIGGSAGVGAGLMERLERTLDRVLGLDSAALVDLVAWNVSLKGRVVGADPYEARGGAGRAPGRMMLNLGHTFGHALETLPGLSWPDPASPTGSLQIGPLKHGEAVGLGLLAAVRLAEGLKMLPARRGGGRGEAPLSERVHVLLHRIGLPTRVMGMPAAEAVLERMGDDKKASGGRVRLVLPARGMRVEVVEVPPVGREAVLGAIESLRG